MVKRVLLTVHKFFPGHRAGTEVLTLKVGQELQRRGCEVLVVTADPPDTDARHASGDDIEEFVYEGLPVKVFREPLRLRGYTFEHEYLHPAMAAEFANVVDAFCPDIVHIFHAQNLSASIIDCARQRDIPVVCSTTDFWFVCPIVQLKLPDGSVCRGPSRGAKNCLSCYTPRLFPPQVEFEQALAAKYPPLSAMLGAMPSAVRSAANDALFEIYKSRKRPDAERATINRPAALREVANRTQAIMVPTLLMRDIFVENGIDSGIIHKVPFGIDTAPLVAFQEKTPSATLRIGFIGTLFEHKGVDLLIEAFQQLRQDADAVLRIYGDLNQFSQYGARLKQLAERPFPNSNKISFCGTFPNSELGSVLQNLDVLVVPSRWYENTPLVMQSALATRTPLVVTDLGGMSEIVQHGYNGLLFKLNDAHSLCEQLGRLAADRQFLRQLRDNIPPERTVAQMVDDIQSIYRSVAQPSEHVRMTSLAAK
ncbi:MAG TPA: glycosyltransferase family 4 protein [Candidatus Obscuribacterales bacterium]